MQTSSARQMPASLHRSRHAETQTAGSTPGQLKDRGCEHVQLPDACQTAMRSRGNTYHADKAGSKAASTSQAEHNADHNCPPVAAAVVLALMLLYLTADVVLQLLCQAWPRASYNKAGPALASSPTRQASCKLQHTQALASSPTHRPNVSVKQLKVAHQGSHVSSCRC